jgi:protein-S-isoprenylcysteine O-methyltransferase Ste14
MICFANDFIPEAWFVVLAVWVILAFRTKRTVERSGGMARLAVIAVLLALVLTRPLANSSLHDQIWAPSRVLSLVAVVLLVIGALFAIWARVTIGANWSGTVTFKQDHQLMQSGPYHVVRHPIYSGLQLMGLASVLQYDEPYGFLMMVVVVAMFIPKILLEEKLMTEHFPDEYPQYRRRVKAIIPFIL